MPEKLTNPILSDVAKTEPPPEDRREFSLADLLVPGRVACNITARGKKHCLEIISRLLTNDTKTLTYAEVFETIYQRERLGSTSLGQGFALPHGRVVDLEHSIGAFLLLTKPIDFDLDGEAGVDMIFALAVPEDSDKAHLNDLSGIAGLFSAANMRERVAGITSSTALYEALVALAGESTNPAIKTDQ